MALKLILGNSGSGKTEYIYEQVVKLAEANPRKNYLCLVPEQYTMQTQRKLVDLSSNQAIMNIDVLSFQRLAFRVFDEMGMTDLQILEETGKNLVLRKVAQEQEDNLTVLKGNMHRMGYISEVKSFISEMMQYNITPQQLEDALRDQSFSPALNAKLQDVHVLYQGFEDFLQGHFITNEYPHSGQNLVFPLIIFPQPGQAVGAFSPHEGQTVALAGMSALHLEQGLYFLPHSRQNLAFSLSAAPQAEHLILFSVADVTVVSCPQR